MSILRRATGPALVSWPVLVVCVIASALVSTLGTGSSASGSRITMAAIGATGGLAGYCVAVLIWWLGFRATGRTIVAVGVAAAAIGGLTRGLWVQVLFADLGYAETDAAQLFLRLVGGMLAGLGAALGTAAGVASVRQYRDTTEQLLAERQRLMSLLNASTQRMEQRQVDTLARVQKRLDDEIHSMVVDSAPSAVQALESLAADVVRPLSHALAHELPEWHAEEDVPTTRVRLRDVWRDSVPSVAIHPILLAAITFGISLPAAIVIYQPRYGLPALTAGTVALALVLAAGRQWILRIPPATSRDGWLRIAIILSAATIAAIAVTSLLDRADASAGVFSTLGAITIPVAGVIIAIVSMMTARMRDMAAELQAVTGQLTWTLARVNTEQWERSGVLSRALHGPVQTLLHARLLRLREQIDRGDVDEEQLVGLRDELQSALAAALSPVQTPRDVVDVLSDVSETWAGLTNVTWHVSTSARDMLAADRLCAHAITDLSTEAVSNAVRHGGAGNVRVDIDVDEERHDLIRLVVVDDGSRSDSEGAGLGTTLLTRCTFDWSLSRGPTTLIARLPVGALVEQSIGSTERLPSLRRAL